ncbi:hypothetical protein [Sphingomonas bacterium]|uniref:hypothetical protein n=1 Tax=Sphingomonas bacterium TaxID=1895847 RepID=UPI00157671D9|nr:hypothetical protein [Sphingomonas bacterium]
MTEARAFGYARVIAPPMWAFVSLAMIELVVAHLLLRHCSPNGALALSVVSGGVVGWIVAGILSFRRRPVLLIDDRLVWPLGTIKRLAVPRAAVAGVATGWTSADARRRDTFDACAFSTPNVLVTLREPVRARRRVIRALAHHLDDPAGFAAALERWCCLTTDERGIEPG